MKYWISVILSTVSILWCGRGYAALTPPELEAAVAEAEVNGRALFNAAQKEQVKDDEVVVVAHNKIQSFCESRYQPVVVDTEHGLIVYFLAQSDSDKTVTFGRHFKVVADTVESSTKGCITLPNPPDALALFITHSLSATPSEFHVYLSLSTKKPIAVGTSAGNWFVESGVITFKGAQ